MKEKRAIDQEDLKNKKSSSGTDETFSQVLTNYKNISFFLDRTAETIRKATILVQQLESEIGRLKYEIMATENEYKNLRHIANEMDSLKSKSDQSS